jgi:RecB family exonuclease
MIYTIPYHKDFPATLEAFFLSEPGNNLLLLPKYLENYLKLPIKTLSYEDFFSDKKTLSNLAETLLLDKILQKNSVPPNKKKAIKEAIKEALHYGLTPTKLLPFTKAEGLFQKILSDLFDLLAEKKVQLRGETLQAIAKNPDYCGQVLKKFNRVFALLPNNFSQVLLELLTNFNVNFISHGFRASPYSLSSSHPHYLLSKILASGYAVEELEGPNFHAEGLSNGLDHLVRSGPFLFTWQEEKLYPFPEVRELLSSSQASEIFLIGDEITKLKVAKIGIISPDIKKLKNFYFYLKNKVKKATIILTVPSSSLEDQTINFFFQIIDFITARPSLDKILSLARSGALKDILDIMPLLQVEKYLIGLEGLDLTDLTRIKDLLQLKFSDSEIIIALLDKFLSLVAIKKAVLLPITDQEISELFLEEPQNSLEKYLLSHLSHFLALVSLDKIPPNKKEGFIKLLLEIKNASLWVENYSFEDYKNLLKDLRKRYPITSEERFIGGTDMIIELILPQEAKQYDLAFLCDLNEGLFPPLSEDHYFISTEARRLAGYEKPNLISSSARDFLSIIAQSKEIILSTVKEKLLLNENKKTESRFSLLLKTYKKLAKTPINTITERNYPLAREQNRKSIKLSLDKKPKNFSATSLEKLMKNPYLYYLHYILKIKYLPKAFQAKDKLPSNREFGILLHKAIHKSPYKVGIDFFSYKALFVENFLAILEKHYGKQRDYFFKLWEGRINYIIKYLYNYNAEAHKSGLLVSHSEKIIKLFLEVKSDLIIELQSTLDRLDYFPNQIKIIDYKTGQIPSNQEIISGIKPQLPFEGLLLTLEQGGDTRSLQVLEEELNPIEIDLIFIRITGLVSSTLTKKIPFDLQKTQEALSKIIKYFYCHNGEYKATNHYNYYLEGQLLRHLDEIEVKI